MRPIVFTDPTRLGEALAARIAAELVAARDAGRRYVLGCPGGRSPASTYAALARLVAERQLDLGHLVIVMMDEYVEEGRAIDDRLPHSCRRFGRETIAGPLGIADDQLWLPDPAAPGCYEERLHEVGGIDLFLLASGASDGHVAFNPPGSAADSVTRVVELADSTRRDNMSTFPTLRSLEEVPRFGVTVGIGTIRRHSRSAVMIVHGAQKETAAARLTAAETYDAQWPATVVADCANAELWIDQSTQRR